MDHYHMYAGKISLFEKAPPRAEVVLEVIGEDRYIFAEAFKPGAVWWGWEGQRGRRGLVGGMMSDYYCAATRSLRPQFADAVKSLQADWDYRYGVSGSITLHTQAPCPTCGITGVHACLGVPTKELTPEEESELKKRLQAFRRNPNGKDSMFITSQVCMVCGKPTANGMIHTCTPTEWKSAPIPDLPITAKKPAAPEGEFLSVFADDRFSGRPWVRINKSGRIKLCQLLMDRFEDMLVDVALDPTTGRIRFGEADTGKALSPRGYLHSRILTRLIEFGPDNNVVIFLDDCRDGWLYGKVPVKDKANAGTPVER
ncbi:hypothetical protein AXL65_21655 [Salmonella enterica subsp. enterica]|nr:hypothetical protein [Salmonella enterica subsp. enterica]